MHIVSIVQNAQLTEVDTTRCMHLYSVLQSIKELNIPGDLVETGVYKGGCSLIMAWTNKKLQMNKKVWLFDSFQGCPNPLNTKLGKHPEETHGEGDFTCSLEMVKSTFDTLGLLDKDVLFVPGWFEDTMPNHTVGDIALLRFDGDLYSSTLDVLRNMYDNVVNGGYVIIDDYSLPACKAAVQEFIQERKLNVNIQRPTGGNDDCGSWWRKE